MPPGFRVLALALALTALGACKHPEAADDPVPTPRAAGIPMGAPGATGARFDPGAAPPPVAKPRLLDDAPKAEPDEALPPDPFGDPPAQIGPGPEKIDGGAPKHPPPAHHPPPSKELTL